MSFLSDDLSDCEHNVIFEKGEYQVNIDMLSVFVDFCFK